MPSHPHTLLPQKKLVSQKVLGRDTDNELHVGLDYALASQAGVDARVLGAVDEVLFLVGNFGQVVAAGIDVDVAGATPAHAAAVMLELNAIVQGHVEHRLAGGRHVGLGRLAVVELEGDGGGGNGQNEKRISRIIHGICRRKGTPPGPGIKAAPECWP